ncbi:MAG: carboxypeptidase regulatory-like domain-containing protein [Chloroflexota bacterium]|nr:carboxypeptidase regulatory-like domain-containing protein [Chloroflexota bacterium]
MRIRVNFRSPVTWLTLSLGLPLLVALGVLGWGYRQTSVDVALPDPSASPIIGIAPDGRPVPLAPTLAPSTPTPAPPSGYFRVEGVVVDEMGIPIQDACIEIGPNGCREHSPHTDSRGVYYMDFPKADVQYDLHFTADGYKEQVKRIQPTANLVLNIMLSR